MAKLYSLNLAHIFLILLEKSDFKKYNFLYCIETERENVGSVGRTVVMGKEEFISIASTLN